MLALLPLARGTHDVTHFPFICESPDGMLILHRGSLLPRYKKALSPDAVDSPIINTDGEGLNCVIPSLPASFLYVGFPQKL